MKRFIFTILYLLALTTVGVAQIFPFEQTYYEKSFKGKIKVLTETEYSAMDKFGAIQKGNIIEKRIVTFNISGNITDDKKYSSNGSLNHVLISKYDEKGNIIEMQEYNSNGSLNESVNFKYDEKGNEIKRTFISKNLNCISARKYDDKGNMIENCSLNMDGSNNGKDIYKYDIKGNKIEESEYNSDGSLNQKETFKYDDKGNQIEQIVYFRGYLSHKFLSVYDDKRNLIALTGYDSEDKLTDKHTFKYNDKGIQVEENWYFNDGVTIAWSQKFDDNGNIIEENKYKSDGSTSSTIVTNYLYDSKENWIKKTEYKNAILQSITEREIEYY